ncbi:bromodomain and PHD finger-containing protein 3 [Mycena filopes]|nr:bromodomain and PHD finger-containing protein 3 [Mycena filopes]
MARGGHVSPVAPAPALPKVAFEKIEDDVSTQPSGVHDLQARGFGYNDFSDFHRPDQYIRHIEPLEIDLERQVEYDMDEQDQEWLDAVNAERKKEQLDRVTYEVFEVVMDRLEKEWFNLTKHIPKPDLALPSEDSTCAICDDSEGENSNAIVFCDGCNLAVHQDCYGVPYIPEGQWLCRKCTVSPENPVSCILCPNEGGAFKQTAQGEWIHLLCAIWVPETRVSNDVFMEPIIGVEKISKQRWKLKCIICGAREGACIQCAKQSCFLAFHVTCARKDRLLLPMKSAQGVEPGALTAYCDKHLPKEQADIREAHKAESEEEEDEEQYNNTKLSKSARAYAKSYRPGPPLVPAIIIDRITQYVQRTNVRKKPEFIAMMCKYWSLKREARRGAPLLKRLHLEPWTASTSAKMQGEEEKVMQLEQLQHLRKDLEDLKNLTQLSRKRETRKLRQAELIQDFISGALFPHAPKLRLAFEKIQQMDRNDYFKLPVSKKDVPDYFEVVKTPMAWINIEAKLDNHEYWDLQSFKDDIHLVLDNAILYNKDGTTFRKAAMRILAAAQPILADLDQVSSSLHLRSTEPTDGSGPSWAPGVIGDLEPPLDILELLVSSDAIQDESDLILSADPITSLFNFEMEKRKPPAPPATPPPPPPSKDKKKRDRAAENAKRKQRNAERAAAAAAALALAASAPLPRTRGAAAAAVAVSAPASRASGSSEASRAPRTRRPSAQMTAPGEIPLVEHVDQRDSFTMFEQGWILPAGTRRNNRNAVDRSPAPAPPPKKRARLGKCYTRGTSRLSVFSTAASDNQTLQTGSPGAAPPVSSGAADNSMDVDEPDRPISKATVVANRSMDSGPSRVIIEELDTPAIRKEKSLRRKEERAAAVAAAAADAQMEEVDPLSPPLSPISPTPDPEGEDGAADDAQEDTDVETDVDAEADADTEGEADADAETDAGSELSALSDLDTAPDDAPIPDEPVPLQEQDQVADVEQHASADGGVGQEEPVGEHAPGRRTPRTRSRPRPRLLWAKAVSFPWWPAIIFGDLDPTIPAKVLQETLQERKKRKGKKDWLYIVRFYDKAQSWYVVD